MSVDSEKDVIDECIEEMLHVIYDRMVDESKPITDDFAKILNDNILDLF